MNVYSIDDIKLEGMNYLQKVVKEKNCEPTIISWVATVVSDFIGYLEDNEKTEENGNET